MTTEQQREHVAQLLYKKEYKELTMSQSRKVNDNIFVHEYLKSKTKTYETKKLQEQTPEGTSKKK